MKREHALLKQQSYAIGLYVEWNALNYDFR